MTSHETVYERSLREAAEALERAKRSQYGSADLARMTPQQVEEARAAGLFADLLNGIDSSKKGN